MEKKNKKHDAIFWPIFVLLLGILVVFLVSGCSGACGCDFPPIGDDERFELITHQYFYTPEIETTNNKHIEKIYWEIYKIKYEGHYYAIWKVDGRWSGITPDLLHESPTIAPPANTATPYNNLDYESIFGKK